MPRKPRVPLTRSASPDAAAAQPTQTPPRSRFRMPLLPGVALLVALLVLSRKAPDPFYQVLLFAAMGIALWTAFSLPGIEPRSREEQEAEEEGEIRLEEAGLKETELEETELEKTTVEETRLEETTVGKTVLEEPEEATCAQDLENQKPKT